MATTSVMVCDGDELGRRALGRTATEHGLTLVGEASTAVQLLQMLGSIPTDVVVIANELQGLTGVEVTPELVAGGHRVIVVSADPLTLDRARQAGAFAAVARGDLVMFGRALDGLGNQAEPGERRSGVDRRSGEDRRVAQDWSKVIRERRQGERRQGDRREQPSAATG